IIFSVVDCSVNTFFDQNLLSFHGYGFQDFGFDRKLYFSYVDVVAISDFNRDFVRVVTDEGNNEVILTVGYPADGETTFLIANGAVDGRPGLRVVQGHRGIFNWLARFVVFDGPRYFSAALFSLGK